MQKITRITSDNRENFTYAQRAEIAERIALRHVLTRAYGPQEQGQAETMRARRLCKAAPKLAAILCSRIESPRAGNRVKHFAMGSDATKTGKRSPLSKLVPNAKAMASMERRQSKGNYDAHVHRRIVERKAITLSRAEREEVFGVVKNVMLTLPEREVKNGKMTLPRETWKAIFAEVRRTIGVKRIMSADVSYEELMSDFGGEQSPDMAIGKVIDRVESREELREKRDNVARRLAFDQECLLAAFRVSTSRKALAAFKGFMAFSVAAAKASLGEGHGMVSYDTAQKLSRRYREQVAWGETLLDCPTHASLPSVESICQEIFIRHEREKHVLRNPVMA